jgi:glycosyltransferase involved in cell wall biosynthesis
MNNSILFLVNTDSFFVSHRLPIAKKLLQLGYEVHIATDFTKYKSQLLKKGFKTHQVNFNKNSINFFNLFIVLNTIFFLLIKIKPKIFHLISIKPVLFGGILALFFPIKGLVISITGLGSMYLRSGFFFKIIENIINQFYKIIFSFENLKIIFQNKDDLEFLLRKTNMKIHKTIIIKGSGIILNNFKFKKISKGIPIILMASRLIADKGVIEYIEAIKYLKSINFKGQFYLIGDPDFGNPSFISLTLIEKWKKDKLIKYLPHQKKIVNYIRKSTIVVLPSYREGFPKILMEAAAVGRPVVTTNTPGCRDAIIKNKTGILVSVKNSVELGEAIKKLSFNRRLLEKMSAYSRIHAKNNFAIENIIAQHISVYNKLLK